MCIGMMYFEKVYVKFELCVLHRSEVHVYCTCTVHVHVHCHARLSKTCKNLFFLSSESEKDSTALMLAALKGDEIIVDILVACVSELL